jgi:DNA-binding protein Fis
MWQSGVVSLTKEKLESVLAANRGNILKTARTLGVSREQVKKKAMEFGLWPWLAREKSRMAELLSLTHGNITRSATLYGMSIACFRNKAKRLGLLPQGKKAA